GAHHDRRCIGLRTARRRRRTLRPVHGGFLFIPPLAAREDGLVLAVIAFAHSTLGWPAFMAFVKKTRRARLSPPGAGKLRAQAKRRSQNVVIGRQSPPRHPRTPAGAQSASDWHAARQRSSPAPLTSVHVRPWAHVAPHEVPAPQGKLAPQRPANVS